MKNFKLSQDAKEFLEGAIYFIVAVTGSLLIASMFFNK